MKKFISKISLFVFMLLIAIVAVLTWHNWSLKHITLPHNISTIVCGDSHTQSAINDSILTDCINISQSLEHYLYTFNVLNLTLRNNSQIERVILGVSYHSFGIVNDETIFKECYNYMYPKYLSIANTETLVELFTNNPILLISQSLSILKGIIRSVGYTKYNQYHFYGAFYKSKKSNLNESSINEAIHRHYYNEIGNKQDFSIIQKKYLNKIIDLCCDKNVELILINTPTSNGYREKIPEKFILDYYNTINKFESKITFWDYSDLELEKKYYGDADHVNLLGAEILSTLIRDRIK
jgi:hypothetical protein